MSPVIRLLVKKNAIAQTRLETTTAAALVAGQVRLRIERFAMTANNVSYAATGDLLQYWRFFPADSDWGCVPAWGFASVMESTLPQLPVGERIWGLYPMATELVVEPGPVSDKGFLDNALHRRELFQVYNEYVRCATDPMHTDGQEDLEALLRPLFGTAWVVDDFLFDHDFFGANMIVLSSASSKTAYATAARLAARTGLEVVGLTAEHNREFVHSLGCYHRVLSYEQINQLDANTASVYLDFSGNAEQRRAIHTQLSQLRYSCAIGASHVDKVGSSSGIPGPKPIFLFAPKQVAKRIAEWGFAGMMQRMAQDWHAFIELSTSANPPWIHVQQHAGVAAAVDAYGLVLQGGGDPRMGHILSMHAGPLGHRS
jgi:hypothetical protein